MYHYSTACLMFRCDLRSSEVGALGYQVGAHTGAAGGIPHRYGYRAAHRGGCGAEVGTSPLVHTCAPVYIHCLTVRCLFDLCVNTSGPTCSAYFL